MKKADLSPKPLPRTIPSEPQRTHVNFADNRSQNLFRAQLIRSIQQKTEAAFPAFQSENPESFVDNRSSAVATKQLSRLIQQSPDARGAIQRKGDDISTDLWVECLRILNELGETVEEKIAALDKGNKEDVDFVLWKLQELGGSPSTHLKLLHDNLLRAWNMGQAPQDLLGKPTDRFALEFSSPIPRDPRIAFLGSDKNDPPLGTPFPGNLLLPAILKFMELFGKQMQGLYPTFMASHLSQLGVLYGSVEQTHAISQNNIRMLEECIQQGTVFLVLHPQLEKTRSTKEEVSILLAQGYSLNDAFQKNIREMDQAIGEISYDLPQLYTPGVVDEKIFSMLIQVARNYIEICENWVRQRSLQTKKQRGRWKRGEQLVPQPRGWVPRFRFGIQEPIALPVLEEDVHPARKEGSKRPRGRGK